MRPLLQIATVAALVAGGILAINAAVSGCGGAPVVAATSAQQADVAAYAAELQACVQAAVANDAGLAGANACMAVVRSRWCGDGGQLAGFCAGQDGGGK